MKAEELRIGNLVYAIDRTGKIHLPITIPLKIFSIDPVECIIYCADTNPASQKSLPVKSIIDLSPILLTPELLLKCGAKEYSGEWQYGISIGAIKLFFRQNCGIWYSELGGIYMGDRFKYIHEVQNIVNALTGQELTIKL